MSSALPFWCILQADGDKALATSRGPVPLQYCSLGGCAPPIQLALQRALQITRPQRLVASVAEAHRRWWSDPLSCLPPYRRVVDELTGRMTVTLATTLAVVEQATADAVVVLQTADMFCASDRAFIAGIVRGVRALERVPTHIVALTIEPLGSNPGQDYLLLGPDDGLPGRSAVWFVKRPQPLIADRLVALGARVSTGVYLARLATLTRTLLDAWPDLMTTARSLVEIASNEIVTPARMVGSAFSRPWRHTWVQRPLPRLRTVSVQECGWSVPVLRPAPATLPATTEPRERLPAANSVIVQPLSRSPR